MVPPTTVSPSTEGSYRKHCLLCLFSLSPASCVLLPTENTDHNRKPWASDLISSKAHSFF